jgi:hypothetical protein
MSGDIRLLTPKDALGKNHRFFVLLGQHHQAEKQNHISLADLIRIRSVILYVKEFFFALSQW